MEGRASAAYHAGGGRGRQRARDASDQLEAALADLRFDATAAIMTVDLSRARSNPEVRCTT